MGFLRRRGNKEPASQSYEQRLRAIGRQIDQDEMRFSLLMESPDGFLLKADLISDRMQGDSQPAWVSRSFWLKDDDIEIIVDDARKARKR
jgi:hypothetical protein